jgi:hypothetical protein
MGVLNQFVISSSIGIDDIDKADSIIEVASRVFDDFNTSTLPLPLFRKLTGIDDDDVTEAECAGIVRLHCDPTWPMRGDEPTDDDWMVERAA